MGRTEAHEPGRDVAGRAHPPAAKRRERPSRQPAGLLRLQRAAGNRAVAVLLGRPRPVVQRADEDMAGTLQARAQAQIDAAKATQAAGNAGEGRQGGADASAPGEAGERPPPPSPEQVAAEKAKQKQAVAGTVSPPDTSGAKSEAADAAAAAKDEAAKPPAPAAGGAAVTPAPAPQTVDAAGGDAAEVTAAAQQAAQAATAAAAEVAPDEPTAVQPPEPLQTVNAGGREIPPDPAMEAGIGALGARLQTLRAGAHQVRSAASAERAQGHRLESLLHAGRGAVTDAALAITALNGHNEHRRSVVQQAKGALDVSAQKAETVASGAPGVSAKSDEGAQKSGPMTSGSKDLAAENAAKTPEDEEAAGKSGEQGSQLTKVSIDVGSIDATIGQTKARAEQLAADSAQAKQANTQSQGQIAATEQAIAETEDKAGQLSEQNDAAQGQLEGFAAEPAGHRAAADELDAQGQALHAASIQLEARLATAQQSYVDGMAATPPPVPARRGRPLQRDAYEGRTAYQPDAAAAAALPSWVSGEDPPNARAAAEHKTQEDSRRAAELAEIDQEAGGHFERLSASQKAGLALQLTGRNLWKGIGDTNLPRFGLTILRGFIDPRVSLMGIVHGFGSIASGVANLFSAEQWEKDPLGNALKSAADIATGVTIVLGSIAGLAVAIGVILTAIAIIGSIFSFGAVGAALAPIIFFCGTVASTVGPWAIEAAAVALVLHALVLIKNLIDAATADTANQLEQSSEQMTEDAQNAGSMAMQIGMAKAMEAGGKLLTGSGGTAPESGALAGEGAGPTPEPTPAAEPTAAPETAAAATPETATAPQPGAGPEPSPAAQSTGAPEPAPAPEQAATPEPAPAPEPAPQAPEAASNEEPADLGMAETSPEQMTDSPGETAGPELSPEEELKQLIAEQEADQARGDVGLTEVEPGGENPLDLPEYQESAARASDAFSRLTNIESAKNIAGTPGGESGTSGWSGEKIGATERAWTEGVEAGHETEPHVFDPEGAEGQYESSHSERQRAAGTSDQEFASSKLVCPACQRWFSSRAGLEGRPQFVADPSGVRVFTPDGRQIVAPHPSGAITMP